MNFIELRRRLNQGENIILEVVAPYFEDDYMDPGMHGRLVGMRDDSKPVAGFTRGANDRAAANVESGPVRLRGV